MPPDYSASELLGRRFALSRRIDRSNAGTILRAQQAPPAKADRTVVEDSSYYANYCATSINNTEAYGAVI
jgi:hypothetical protein